MKLIKIIISFFIPIFFNNLINLSEGFYISHIQRFAVDVLVIFGVIVIILVQTYGTYRLLDYVKLNKEAKE